MTGLDTARGRSFFVEIFFKCSPSLRRHSQFKFPIIIPGRSERKVHAWSKDPACRAYDVYGVHRRGICRKYSDGSAGSGGGGPHSGIQGQEDTAGCGGIGRGDLVVPGAFLAGQCACYGAHHLWRDEYAYGGNRVSGEGGPGDGQGRGMHIDGFRGSGGSDACA